MFGLFRKKEKQAQRQSATHSSGSAYAEVFERIVPVIKVLENNATGGRVFDLPDADMPVSQSFAGDLIVMYAEDLPSHFAYLSNKRMHELGLGLEELHSLAVQNLSRRVPPIKIHGTGPHYMITAGGNFEATLLLHPTLWDSLSAHLHGSPIAAVPTRDLLFITGAKSAEGRTVLKKMAEQDFENKSHLLSRRLFVRCSDTGSWTVFTPDSE